MAIDGVKIIDSDDAYDIYNDITERYKNGEDIEKIRKYLSPDDFSNELYKEILLKIYEKSALNMPLESIIDEYADTENHDNISGLFTASLSDEINLSEKRKIAEENILKLRQARLDELSKHSTDIVQLQKIIHEQSKLKKEGISID